MLREGDNVPAVEPASFGALARFGRSLGESVIFEFDAHRRFQVATGVERLSGGRRGSGFYEFEQVGVNRTGFSRGHAMWKARVCFQGALLEQSCRQGRRIGIGHDLVVIAMHHQDRHINLFKVFREVSLGESDDAVVMRFGAAHHALTPPVPDHAWQRLHAGPVETIEWPGWHIVVELSAVGRNLRLKIVEHGLGQSAGIGLGLHHQRRHRGDEHRFCNPVGPVTRDVMHHFAAAG